jgi:hypothetical protein
VRNQILPAFLDQIRVACEPADPLDKLHDPREFGHGVLPGAWD